jgi:tetratricopeptide (TPR) repeat protein
MISGASDCGNREAAAGRGARRGRDAILGAVCVLVIGVFAWSARSGMLEARAWRAEDTYYNLLVRALRAGQLNLMLEVPSGFAQLANPYDPVANVAYRSADGHPLHDLSYYQGKLYLYFGITPVLVLFWPYTALTGHYLLHQTAALIFCSVGFLASAGVLRALGRRYFAEVGVGVVAAGTLGLGLASFAPLLLQRCDVYQVSVSCGYALMMLALAAIWGALHQPRRRGWWLAAASLACGLAAGARPSLVLGAAILLVPLAQAWRERGQFRAALLAAIGPLALIGFGLMLYNALRFDNPLEFGRHYQLASYRPDLVQDFSWRYLGFNSWVYFLAPARWSAHLPFVHDVALPPRPAGHFGTEHPFGVLTSIPLVWLALAAPLAWRGCGGDARRLLRGFVAAAAWLVGACALTLCFFFASCDRYQMEFVPALVLVAVIGIFGLERALAGRPAWQRLARCGWGALLAFSVAFNLFSSAAQRAEAHLELANFLIGTRGQLQAGIEQYRQALRIQPDDAVAHNHLGNLLLQQGNAEEAARQFAAALQTRPDYPEAHYQLAVILAGRKQAGEAIPHLREAVRLKPDWLEAINNLAWLLATQPGAELRNAPEAVRLAARAVELTHTNQPGPLDTLAAAYATASRFPEAVAAAQQAVELAAAAGQNQLAAEIQQRRQAYAAGQPFRE